MQVLQHKHKPFIDFHWKCIFPVNLMWWLTACHQCSAQSLSWFECGTFHFVFLRTLEQHSKSVNKYDFIFAWTIAHWHLTQLGECKQSVILWCHSTFINLDHTEHVWTHWMLHNTKGYWLCASFSILYACKTRTSINEYAYGNYKSVAFSRDAQYPATAKIVPTRNNYDQTIKYMYM